MLDFLLYGLIVSDLLKNASYLTLFKNKYCVFHVLENIHVIFNNKMLIIKKSRLNFLWYYRRKSFVINTFLYDTRVGICSYVG